jgi:hypothetical protein
MKGVVAALSVLTLAALFGRTGEEDRRDALRYSEIRAEIAASAPAWAVRQ